MRKVLPAAVLCLCCVAAASNMYMSHGHNYTFLSPADGGREQVIFPVVWDVRTAASLLSKWEDLYHPQASSPFESILQEAAQSGINTIILRSELGDSWFPDMPGALGDDFYPRAAAARELGLNLIPGGIVTELGQDSVNQAVLDYLELYVEMTAGQYSGQVIGCFGFDEPDVKYLEQPENQLEWIQNVSYWSEQCRSRLGLNVISYLAKHGTEDESGGTVFYSDTSCVLNRMARYTDGVAMDMYPAKNNFRRTDLLETDHAECIFTAATDMIQDDQLQESALNSRDEVIRVFAHGDSAEVVISDINWDGEDLDLITRYSFEPGFLPEGFASSDYRSGYTLYEGQGYVNSGVVLWRSDLPVDRAVLIHPFEGVPVMSSFPRFAGSEDLYPVFISVGQTDFWPEVTGAQGVIGRGRLAILACLQDVHGDLWTMLYVGSGSTVYPAFSTPRKLHFQPEGAVWGTFWGTWYEFGTIQPVARNGFIVYGEDGSYVTLNQLGRDYWQYFPNYGTQQFHHLFGSGDMPDFIRVSRVDGTYPPFFSGRDLITGFFQDEHRIITGMSMYNGGPLTELDTMQVAGLPGDVTGFELYRNDYRYSDRPLFTTASGEVLYGSGAIDTGIETGEISVKPVRYCSGTGIAASVRPMYTRDSIRSALILDEQGYYMPHCEIYSDIMDHVRFQWYPQVHRTGLEIGVRETERDNMLFAVVQSYGRHGFALPSYCVSPDTMLYMVTTPIVEGARGIVFYAMDLAMMSGNGGDDGTSRAPWVLQNWGPSRDVEHRDMISTIHGVVSELTGNGPDGFDYLSTLVDPGWKVLDDQRVHNSDPADTLLNFIALENPGADTVMVIAVNQATDNTSLTRGLVFRDLPPGFTVATCTGWEPIGPLQSVEPFGSSETILDYSGIPPLTASVLTLAAGSGGECQGSWLNTATSSQGRTVLTFSMCNMQQGELLLYDMAGRMTARLWSGTGEETPFTISLQRGAMPAGLYFAVLRTGDTLVSGKCFLW